MTNGSPDSWLPQERAEEPERPIVGAQASEQHHRRPQFQCVAVGYKSPAEMDDALENLEFALACPHHHH